jgi:glutathione S-transferase
LVGDAPTIADFSIGAWVPAAPLLQLPIEKYPEVGRWYEGVAALPGWHESMVPR